MDEPKKENRGGSRGGGRPALAGIEKHNVSLTKKHWKVVDHIGNGNRSAGTRDAIEAYVAANPDKYDQETFEPLP